MPADLSISSPSALSVAGFATLFPKRFEHDGQEDRGESSTSAPPPAALLHAILESALNIAGRNSPT